MTTRAVVLGAGSWGTTFGKILADGGAQVTMWARRPELAHEIDEAKRNSRYLPGINLPRSMRATSDLAKAVAGADQLYVSVPSKTAREALKVFLDTKWEGGRHAARVAKLSKGCTT